MAVLVFLVFFRPLMVLFRPMMLCAIMLTLTFANCKGLPKFRHNKMMSMSMALKLPLLLSVLLVPFPLSVLLLFGGEMITFPDGFVPMDFFIALFAILAPFLKIGLSVTVTGLIIKAVKKARTA